MVDAAPSRLATGTLFPGGSTAFVPSFHQPSTPTIVSVQMNVRTENVVDIAAVIHLAKSSVEYHPLDAIGIMYFTV